MDPDREGAIVHGKTSTDEAYVPVLIALSAERKNTMLQRLLTYLIILAGLLLSAAFPAQAADREAAEYEVKAAYVYNFAKFVEWPPESFSRDDVPLTICILGGDPFGSAMNAIKRKTVGSRKVAVKQVSDVQEAKGCHVLFVSASEEDRLQQTLDSLGHAGVLTISDMRKFAQTGGMINFIIRDDKVRFAINAGAARRAGLKISSQLLSLAVTVIE